MAVPCKGVQAVRTLSGALGTGAHSKERHVRQFRLGCLELERTRRIQERGAALQRISVIESRLSEIDLEIHDNHWALDLRQAGAGAQEARRVEPEQARPPRRKIIRYGA